MTREEAIQRLKANRGAMYFPETREALDMAIQALDAERESGDMQTELDKDNRTLWVKTNSTETLDGITRVIVQGEHPWCKVFYEDYNTNCGAKMKGGTENE